MCDENTFKDIVPDDVGDAGDLTRRAFNTLSLGAGLTMMLPRAANALEVTATDVDIDTPDGVADGFFVHPVTGAHPGVLIFPDARGFRLVYRQMATRLAEEGYAVLVYNPYYRGKRAPVLPEGASTSDPATMQTLRPLLAQLTPATDVTDAVALLGWLDAQAAVDGSRKLGTMGYCLGGPMTMRAAAARPDRVGAGASFHGVRLATDAADSPHRLVPEMRAGYLFAIAEDDDANDPEAKKLLREAFAGAGLAAEIEVYAGTRHSWCTADSPVHNAAQAERAWGRMLVLFARALA